MDKEKYSYGKAQIRINPQSVFASIERTVREKNDVYEVFASPAPYIWSRMCCVSRNTISQASSSAKYFLTNFDVYDIM